LGRHYVPQRYLRNFEIPECPGFVWLHDKQSGKSRPAAIDKVAQSKGYYSDEVERALATDIEAPGNAVMAKLRQNDALSATERVQMTAYMATMLKRVPYRRRKALEMLPGVLSGTTERIRQELIEAAATIPSSLGDDWLIRRLEELDAAHAKFEKEPPEEVVRQIREPWPTRDMLGGDFPYDLEDPSFAWPHVLLDNGQSSVLLRE
jgi:uncharacterized protein DUF4238